MTATALGIVPTPRPGQLGCCTLLASHPRRSSGRDRRTEPTPWPPPAARPPTRPAAVAAAARAARDSVTERASVRAHQASASESDAAGPARTLAPSGPRALESSTTESQSPHGLHLPPDCSTLTDAHRAKSAASPGRCDVTLPTFFGSAVQCLRSCQSRAAACARALRDRCRRRLTASRPASGRPGAWPCRRGSIPMSLTHPAHRRRGV